MNHDFGAAKSSDLYTAELPPGLENPEGAEAQALATLDGRIAAAKVELTETNVRLAELLTPQAEETGGGVLANIQRFCEHAAEGIARFFHSLFGTPELPEAGGNPEVAEVLQRLDLRQEHLRDLQEIRAEMLQVSARLLTLQDGDPGTLLPQAQQLRTELAPISDALREFAWKPVMPGETPAMPELPVNHEAQEVRTRVVGDPVGDAAYWHQQGGAMTCAIVDQEMILDKLAGNPGAADEFNLEQEAIAKGWARADGATSPAYVGYLLQERGIHTETVLHEGINRLAERLESGQEAIVGVRGEILWGLEPVAESGSDLNPADHAIWVTGAKVAEHNGVREVVSVFVNDSGAPNGCGREVPVEQFLRAWAASDDYVVYAQPRQ